MRRSRPGAVLVAFLSVATALPLAVAPRPAHADEDAEEERAIKLARKHFKKGQKLFALRKFAEALVEYQLAFEAYPAPDILFNIAQCHRNLGDHDAAIFTYKKYLRLVPDADNREAVEKLIEELEAKRAEEQRKARKARKQVEPIPDGRDDGPKRADGKPITSRWWFWTGVVVVAGAAGAYALTRDTGGPPDSDLGNLDFPR